MGSGSSLGWRWHDLDWVVILVTRPVSGFWGPGIMISPTRLLIMTKH